MAISNNPPRVSLVANGSSPDFNFGFKIWAAGDLIVYLDGTQQTLTTHYTVSIRSPPAEGGTVSFVSTPTNGQIVVLQREVAQQRGAGFQQAGDFAASVVNEEFDKLVAMVQEHESDLDRVSKFSDAYPGSASPELPDPTALQFLRWNSTALALENATVAGTISVSGNGVLVHTAPNTFASRTITGTANQVSVSRGDGVSGNPTIGLASDTVLPGTGAVTVPTGTTAQRPGSPTTGMLRYNSDNSQLEAYAASAWRSIAPIPSGFIIACSTETGLLSAATNVARFVMPANFHVTRVEANLATAQTSGNILTIDINASAVTILSTKLTVDNTEKSSRTAAIAAVISDADIDEGEEVLIDIDQIGDGTAAGLKVTLFGHQR